MITAEQYTELGKRLDGLAQKRAVLLSKEKDKAERRKELAKKLKAGGVDLDQPEEEVERLRAEIDQAYTESRKMVDEFEEAMDAASGLVIDDSHVVVIDTGVDGMSSVASLKSGSMTHVGDGPVSSNEVDAERLKDVPVSYTDIPDELDLE